MVSSEKGDVSWVLQLKAQQKLEGLNRVEASVDEVTHENVSGVWDLSSLVEQLQQIVELSMDITTNLNSYE